MRNQSDGEFRLIAYFYLFAWINEVGLMAMIIILIFLLVLQDTTVSSW